MLLKITLLEYPVNDDPCGVTVIHTDHTFLSKLTSKEYAVE
jgi:hypothetical protein